MYKNIKVKNHKGINEILLDDLGHLNILFGKNNSGKTSIMEGLISRQFAAIGKPVAESDTLVGLFEQDANKYFSNYSRKAVKAFTDYLESKKEQNTIWYYGEEEAIIDDLTADMSKTKELQNIKTMFDMEGILKKWFQDVETGYNPILIPPKRKLEARVGVNLDQKITTFGRGIANHLFFLKNQNPGSTGNNSYKQVLDAFTEISDYEFDIIPDSENHIRIVFKRINEETWIPAEDSGLGLADLLILITFALETSHSIICIEEPESHLHPELQKRFLNFLKSIQDKQFIISTHSNIFLNPSIVDAIYYIQYEKSEVKVSNETENSRILYNLGYSISEHLIADVVVLVEHASVIPVLNAVFSWIELDKHFNINYFPLSGNVRAYLDLSIFSGKQNIVALTCTRSDSEVETARFYHNCENINIEIFRLNRASVENYFTVSALKKVFGSEIPDDIEAIEHHISVDAQIGFSLKHKSVKTHNSQIIQAMSLDDIEGTDLLKFCTRIHKLISKEDVLQMPLLENNKEDDVMLLNA